MSTTFPQLQYTGIRPLIGRWRMAWWSAFAAILIGGFLLVGIGYRHGLPFVDEPDEMTIWAMGHAYIDPSWAMFQPSQPPALIRLSELIQRLQLASGDPYINVSGTLEIMRLLSVICFAVSLGLVMLLGRRVAGPIAGIVGGLVYAALPLANELGKLSTHNLFMTVFFVGSLAAGVEGWDRKSLRWLALSFILAIISALFKWQGGAAIGVAGLACLSFYRTDRRKALTGLIPYVILLGLFAYWAIFIHRILEGEAYLPGVKAIMPTPGNILRNLYYGSTESTLIFGVLPIIGLVLAAVLPAVRRRIYGKLGIWSWILVLIAFSAILSFYGAPVFERQYLAMYPLLAVLAGLAVALLLECSALIATRTKQSWLRIALSGAVLIVLALSIAPMLNASVRTTANALRPDRRNLLADWARTTAVDGAMFFTRAELASSVQTLYGYRGRAIDTPYNVNTGVLLNPDSMTAADLQSHNVHYLVAPPGTTIDQQKLGLPLTQLTEMNFGQGNYAGDVWAVWYIGHLPQVSSAPVAVFGHEVVLRGYELSTLAVCRGHNVTSQMLWGSQNTPSRYYSTFMHLYSASSGELSEPINGDPLTNADRPTITWQNPDEVIVGLRHEWAIRADMPPGQYEVRLGVFDPISSQRLTTEDGKDYALLGKITVIDCGTAQEF